MPFGITAPEGRRYWQAGVWRAALPVTGGANGYIDRQLQNANKVESIALAEFAAKPARYANASDRDGTSLRACWQFHPVTPVPTQPNYASAAIGSNRPNASPPPVPISHCTVDSIRH